MKAKYKKYRNLSNELKLSHYERLRNEVPESIESSKYHIEIINMLKIISRHSSNIAKNVFEWMEKKGAPKIVLPILTLSTPNFKYS